MFANRKAAGEALAKKLEAHEGADTVIFALPRGGVPVAAPVAKRLKAPLSLLFVKKIGAPGQPELAIGAIVDGEEPTQILHNDIIRSLHVSELYLSTESDLALAEIERRRALYAGLYARVSPKGKTAVIIDDGLATGASMEAAISAVRQQGATRIIGAIPIAPTDIIEKLKSDVDELICLDAQESFHSVSQAYHEFMQLSDADVMEVLNEFSGDERSLVQKRA
ncbi:MAG: phosphoribosyltransferase [Marinicaulis sp.]|nr:hypothetical protein [Marinicaulis sp.]NNE40740.1 phosphoribosyltransferase [Marinicaulis sp.]NNL89613.1 phosphoribosyltransferase [Marinicaulis sp.]